jgi:hypothetical protein
MVFVKKSRNLVWKNRQDSILAKLACITMPNHLVFQSTITQVVTTITGQRVCEITTNFGPVPYVDTNKVGADYGLSWNQLSARSGQESPVQ